MVNYTNEIFTIIQARINSTRLPGKVLKDIEDKPMLWHIIKRLQFSKRVNDIILAIPDTKENNILEKFAIENGVKYFKGNEEDVLSRYYETAKKFNCNTIVRVTADDPLIDPQIIDLTINKHLTLDADYTSNNLKRTFPIGLDVEVFNLDILEKSHKEAKENYQREHVTPYIRENPHKFKLAGIENDKNFSHMRWTVDEIEDLSFVREIYKKLYSEKQIFYMEDIVMLLKEHPELMKINKNIEQKNY